MDYACVLLATVLLVQGMGAAIWWMGGHWLGLSRRTARHWLVAVIANGVALALIPLQEIVEVQASVLVINVLVMHGVISMRRGLQGFLRLAHTDSSHLLLGFGVMVFNLGLCLPLGQPVLGGSVSAALIGWLLLRTASENHGPLAREYGRAFARAHSTALSLAAMGFLLAALVMGLPGWHAAWQAMDLKVRLSLVIFTHLLLSMATTVMGGYMVVRRLVRKLEHLSDHDALTGLHNRRAVDGMLAREMLRLQRFGQPFSVLMLDIDHFKRINDRLGHAAGDAALQAVAQALVLHAREVDHVARFGGEEFCVILPHTLHEGALQAAERLREAISQINVPWQDDVITLTISTGLATADDPAEPQDHILRRADQALYRAKSGGRNCVVVSSNRLMVVA